MSFDNPILFFFCSIGVFNGFFASMYFLFFSKEKRTQNSLFGLLLLFLCMRIGKSVYIIFTEKESRSILVSQIGLSACFLIGIALFFYIKSSVNNRKNIPKSWKTHFLILTLIITVFGIVKPYSENITLWHTYVIHIIYAVWGIYIVLSGILLKNIFTKLFSKSQKLTISEAWLVWVFTGNVLIYKAYLIGYFYLYLIGTISFSVVFYGLLIFLLFKNNRENIFKDIPEKYASKKIEKTEANFLIKQLNVLMKEKELYKESDVKLLNIAKHIHISTHKLSQLLNDNLGKSFASFINDYRVEEAKRLLRENNKITSEAIGYESCFSSKSSFYAIFKKVVGKTPSEFRKEFL